MVVLSFGFEAAKASKLLGRILETEGVSAEKGVAA
jgi:hypothetical protein